MSQDIILKQPEFVKILTSHTDPNALQLLRNPRHLGIIRILHELGNKADLTEITDAYADIAKDNQAKSESTVYRCLQELKEFNIVFESGQRVIEGKTLTRTLYSLTSDYLLVNEPRIEWDSPRGQQLFNEIVRIFQYLYPDISINEKCIFQWEVQFQRTVDIYKTQLMSSNNTEILDLASIWSFLTINDLMEYIGWLSVLLNNADSQTLFLECFQKNSLPIQENKELLKPKSESQVRQSVDIIREWPRILTFLPLKDPSRPYLSDPAYIPLQRVFLDGILSMKEIIKKYNDISLVQRKDSTIYRYVQILKSLKLVREVGQRVVRGKKATEKLYALKGRILSLEEIKTWDSDQRQWILDATIKILQYLFPELPEIDREKFLRFRLKATALEVECAEKIQSSENNAIVQILYKYEWQDFWLIYTTLIDFYFFYNIPELFGELSSCLQAK